MRSTPNNTEEQNEQAIKQRFEMSHKILNIREKYYKPTLSFSHRHKYSASTSWSARCRSALRRTVKMANARALAVPNLCDRITKQPME